MSNTQCKHGERVSKSGTSKTGTPWTGLFCPTPKGTPDQCAPEWVDLRPKTSAGENVPKTQENSATRQTKAVGATPEDILGDLENILRNIERVTQKVKVIVTSKIPF